MSTIMLRLKLLHRIADTLINSFFSQLIFVLLPRFLLQQQHNKRN